MKNYSKFAVGAVFGIAAFALTVSPTLASSQDWSNSHKSYNKHNYHHHDSKCGHDKYKKTSYKKFPLYYGYNYNKRPKSHRYSYSYSYSHNNSWTNYHGWW